MVAPPNVVWLVSDHQALGNRPAMARSFAVQSGLADHGVTFTNAYTVLPICTPSRASMLTGLYPHNHGLTENEGRFGGRPGLDHGDWLVHQPFAAAGYRCGWFGKWHLHPTQSAADFGFEGFSLPGYGYPYGADAYGDYLKRWRLPPPVVEIEMPGESGRPAGERVALRDAASWFDFEAGTALLHGPAETHEAFFVARLAGEWLKTVAGEPFFLRVDPWGPHPPYMVAPPFRDTVANSGFALGAGFHADLRERPAHHRAYRDGWARTLGLDEAGWRHMTARSLEQAALVEAALASVLTMLEELGLRDNTIVVFSADHGDAVGSNGGVANKGGLLVEETLRVPLVMAGPGLPAGRVSQSLAANIDLAPTLLELCGLAGDASDQPFDGVSLVPGLNQPASQTRQGLMLEHYGLHELIVQRAYLADGWKLVVQDDGFIELYDLPRDPFEMNNLARREECAGRLAELLAGLRREMQRTGDDDNRLAGLLRSQAAG
ncbi:MAG: sulfatase-like hydrolase/transferase [Alphaproteobacteria bacterium]